LCCFYHHDVLQHYYKQSAKLISVQLQGGGVGISGTVYKTDPDDPDQESTTQHRPQPNQVLHSILADHHVVRVQVLQPAASTRNRGPNQLIFNLLDFEKHLLLIPHSLETDFICVGGCRIVESCGMGDVGCVCADDFCVSV
jgi:hypothetical protein